MLEICEYEPRLMGAVKQVIEAVLYDELGFTPDTNLDDDIHTIEKYYSRPDGIFLVALLEGKVVRTGALRKLSLTDCEIKRMFVLRSFRGQGIGSQILKQLISFAEERGYRNVLLDTTREMKAAIRLYKKFGFSEIAPYNLNQRAQVFMEKKLDRRDSR